jgi:Beta-L-arabinofuranosidase, GH127
LRVPDWSTHAHVTSDSAHIEQRGRYIVVQKLWRAGDSIRLKFDARVELVRSSNGEVAFKYGPLVFAELLPSLKVNKKAYRLRGFEDFYLKASRVEKAGLPANREGDRFGFNLVLLSADGDRLRPFDKPLLALEGEVSVGPSAVPRRVRLVPLGNAPLLRRVTFPIWPTRSGP